MKRTYQNQGNARSRCIRTGTRRLRKASPFRLGGARRGTALAELAVCLPLIVVAVLGSIELCNAIHLKQSLTAAGYEGALVASQPMASETAIVQRIQAVLDARGINGTAIGVICSGSFDALPPGDLFTLRVEADTASNILVPVRFVTAAVVGVEVSGHRQE